MLRPDYSFKTDLKHEQNLMRTIRILLKRAQLNCQTRVTQAQISDVHLKKRVRASNIMKVFLID